MVCSRCVVLACLLARVTADEPSWVRDLKADGYHIREGVLGYFTTKTCAISDTCYALNPITPYGLFYLPPHPDETSAGNYSNTCHVHNLCKEVDGETFAPNWRVAPGETIVVVGRTPPESSYWSFTPYLYTRFNEAGFEPTPKDLSHRIVECPKGSSRCEIFSSVNDPLNMQTVQTTDGSPFNSSFSMVLSWDSEVESEVAHKLHAANEGLVNYLQFPGAIGKLGVTKGNEDEYMALMRIEGIKSKEAADEFYGKSPFRVFRVSRPLDKPPAASSAYASFDGKMRTRWTGQSEAGDNATNDQLRDGLERLKELIIKENTRLMDYTTLQFESFVNDSGYECLDQGLKCQGDCRDTIYAKATLITQETLCNATHLPCKPSRYAELTDEKNDGLFVMGVNHKMTKQSLYSSVTLYNFPRLAAGILKTSDDDIKFTMKDDDYKGSAQHLLLGHPAAPYLYAIKFARACGKDERVLCVEVPSKTSDPDQTAMSLTDELVILERMYIHPGTKSGPAVEETILPTLLHVRPRIASQIIV